MFHVQRAFFLHFLYSTKFVKYWWVIIASDYAAWIIWNFRRSHVCKRYTKERKRENSQSEIEARLREMKEESDARSRSTINIIMGSIIN